MDMTLTVSPFAEVARMGLPRLQCLYSPIVLLQQEGDGLNHGLCAVYCDRAASPWQTLRVLAALFSEGVIAWAVGLVRSECIVSFSPWLSMYEALR